jgi:hypothetical protein
MAVKTALSIVSHKLQDLKTQQSPVNMGSRVSIQTKIDRFCKKLYKTYIALEMEHQLGKEEQEQEGE